MGGIVTKWNGANTIWGKNSSTNPGPKHSNSKSGGIWQITAKTTNTNKDAGQFEVLLAFGFRPVSNLDAQINIKAHLGWV